MATVRDLDELQALARECGRDWAIYTDGMPASEETGKSRQINSIVVRVNRGRTVRFVDAHEAAEFIRQPTR